MKNNTLKTITATMIAVIIMTSYAVGQWTTNGNNIYNNNSGNVGLSATGNFTNPAYLLDVKGDINIDLSASNASAFRIGGNRMLWNNGNTNDIFVGYSAGNTSMTGHSNSALGSSALTSNTSGIDNVAIGNGAGQLNTTGSYGTYVGYAAGQSNVAGAYSTFVGYIAGNLSTGTGNTYVGLDAGYANTSGGSNTGIGLQVLGQTTTGAGNTGSNTGCGYKAGYANTTGTNNTFVGYQADASGVGSGAFTNCGAFGSGATTNASNKYVIGNTSVTVIGGQVGWSTLSDGRFKINVKENVSGLDFINKLRPVTYNMDTKALDAFINQTREPAIDSLGITIPTSQQDFSASTNIVHSGFIAQEIEEASKACGYNSTIVNAPANSNDPYSLNYSELVVPLVKAVQQLDATNRELQAKLTALQDQVNGCCNTQQGNSSDGARAVAIDVALTSGSIVLDQNQPNPFKEQTTIAYFIPDDSKDVKIIFTDSKGTVLKEVEITQTGKGQLNVFAQDLSSGIYTYSIVADGITIDSKKMVCTK